MLRAGNESFQKVSQKTSEKFDMAEDESISTELTRFFISKNPSSTITISKNSNLKKTRRNTARFHFFSFSFHVNAIGVAL